MNYGEKARCKRRKAFFFSENPITAGKPKTFRYPHIDKVRAV
jgi:hypothetical protein